ncbi:hypothetical protein M2146_001031 [Lachnospiraceae bacterium PF1-22]
MQKLNKTIFQEWEIVETKKLKDKELYLLQRTGKTEINFRIVMDSNFFVYIQEQDCFEGNLSNYVEFVEEHLAASKVIDVSNSRDFLNEFGISALLLNLSVSSVPLHEILELEETEEFKKNQAKCIAKEILKRLKEELKEE